MTIRAALRRMLTIGGWFAVLSTLALLFHDGRLRDDDVTIAYAILLAVGVLLLALERLTRTAFSRRRRTSPPAPR